MCDSTKPNLEVDSLRKRYFFLLDIVTRSISKLGDFEDILTNGAHKCTNNTRSHDKPELTNYADTLEPQLISILDAIDKVWKDNAFTHIKELQSDEETDTFSN